MFGILRLIFPPCLMAIKLLWFGVLFVDITLEQQGYYHREKLFLTNYRNFYFMNNKFSKRTIFFK